MTDLLPGLDEAELVPDEPVTTKEGWRRFVDHHTEPPVKLRRPRTPKEYDEFALSHWFRPEAQPSTYLYTATEPVPWPDREGGQRSAAGGRPLLPNERHTRAKVPVQVNRLR